jgi:hypothetical protein
VVGEAESRGQAGVVEGADEVVAAFAEVGPAVVVGRDDRRGAQDRGRGGGPDAVQAQRPALEPDLDAGGADVQDNRVNDRVRRAISATVPIEALSPLTSTTGRPGPDMTKPVTSQLTNPSASCSPPSGAVHGGDDGRAAHHHGRALLPRPSRAPPTAGSRLRLEARPAGRAAPGNKPRESLRRYRRRAPRRCLAAAPYAIPRRPSSAACEARWCRPGTERCLPLRQRVRASASYTRSVDSRASAVAGRAGGHGQR